MLGAAAWSQRRMPARSVHGREFVSRRDQPTLRSPVPPWAHRSSRAGREIPSRRVAHYRALREAPDCCAEPMELIDGNDVSGNAAAFFRQRSRAPADRPRNSASSCR